MLNELIKPKYPCKYKNFIIFKSIIPHELLINGQIELEYEQEIDGLLDKKKRKYYVSAERKYIKDQIIPADSSSFSSMTLFKTPDVPFLFSYNITNMELYIEISDSELERLKDVRKVDHSKIMQSILLSFSRYYNEAIKGNDCYKPCINGYGPGIVAVYTNYGKKNISAVIFGTYAITRNYKRKILENNKDTSHLPWRYYYYKSLDDYNVCEYLDSIIWLVISAETYIMSSIISNNLKDEFEEKYKNKTRTVFNEITFLEEKKVFSKEKSKAINKVLSKIVNYRNEIVHGDIDSTYYSAQKAKESIEKMTSFYEKYENNNL